jgi:hypothetical protein
LTEEGTTHIWSHNTQRGNSANKISRSGYLNRVLGFCMWCVVGIYAGSVKGIGDVAEFLRDFLRGCLVWAFCILVKRAERCHEEEEYGISY